ncbi:MAG: Dabb family protein [Microthrixaceae bacterium]
MLVHTVLLKFSTDTSEDHLDRVCDSLRGLPAVIPTLVSYRVGRDLGLAEDNFQIAVVAEFADEAGYVAYRDDRTHRSIITEQIQPHLVARSASQFQT